MSRTLFTNGRIFAGTGAPPAEGDITIEDGRIVAIGRGLDGDTAVDLEGRGVLPGLFDCHVHVQFTNIDMWGLVQQPFSLQFYEAARNLAATLAAGITTLNSDCVCDMPRLGPSRRIHASSPPRALWVALIM